MVFCIGRHFGINGDISAVPHVAREMGCDIFQIFLGAPQLVISKPRLERELVDLRSQLKKTKTTMVIHGSYTINLCHPVSSKKFAVSVKSLIQDLHASSIIGEACLGVIIHMGKNIPVNHISDSQAIANYIQGLETAIKKTPDDTTIILETGASQGSEVASEIDGLAEIYHGLSESSRQRIMFCIDTCHIWATGYDISTPRLAKRFFKEFDEKIGIDKISCIHFNNSKTACQSCVDRHADLAYGLIDVAGLREIVKIAKKHDIPLVMETPLSSIDTSTNQEITILDELSLVKKWSR